MKETILKVKGKVVGKMIGSEYITTRKKDKHFMLMFQGYGISQKILDYLKGKNVQKVKIVVGYETFSFSLDKYLNSTKVYDNQGDLQRFVSTNETFKNTKLNRFVK